MNAFKSIPQTGSESMRAAWTALDAQRNRLQQTHLAELFAADPERFANYSCQLGPLLLDYSKQRVDREVLQTLAELADAADLAGWTDRLFAGEEINCTEQRAVMHWALRLPADAARTEQNAPVAEVQAQLQRMQVMVDKLHAGQWRGATGDAITDVVNIGVGGSDLGPLMVCRALVDQGVKDCQIRVHFASTMDGSQLAQLLKILRPQTTLFIVSSKSFGTVDTLYNAETARAWLQRKLDCSESLVSAHFIGVSSNVAKMTDWGIRPENQLQMWDWVGGRFSLWSCIGLPIALKVGMQGFRDMLAGAHQMDEHFRSAPWLENIPVLMALLGVWNTNCLGIHAHAILPYDGRLERLPAYLEQLEMESNGKSVSRDGEPVDQRTCPVLWGEVGPNAQHAFYQLLHQGTEEVTCDFIAPALRYHEPRHNGDASELIRQHELALANCLAQSRLLALGEAALENPDQLPFYKRYRGNQPSSTLMLKQIDPHSIGALIAAYEHKVFTQSVIWGINPFDQWGVEMGKIIAEDTLSLIRHQPPATVMDSSTQGLINFIHQQD